MIKPIVLDTGPLGRIAHPKSNPEIKTWLTGALQAGAVIILPEIADYELRREFLHIGLTDSLKRLDDLKSVLTYMPLTTALMMKAAELWAQARKFGQSTSHPKELDGDTILAAQALSVNGVVATENVGHLTRFVEARHWRDIRVDQSPAGTT